MTKDISMSHCDAIIQPKSFKVGPGFISSG